MSFPAQGYTPTEPTKPKNQTAIGIRSGAIGANEEAFATDLTPASTVAGEEAVFSILICYQKATIMEVTFDSGANWCILNEALDILERALYYFIFPVAHGDGFNIRFKDADNIIALNVGEVIP